jgi:steroid delta-isomerase-like uncharacterized protein
MDRTRSFLRRWLAAWTGNRPDELLCFYAEDVLYRDPAHPRGLRGKPALRSYLKKLLARYPDWVWELREVVGDREACAVKWKATVPTGDDRVTIEGLDLVEIRDDLIVRNEVYFDPRDLPTARSS